MVLLLQVICTTDLTDSILLTDIPFTAGYSAVGTAAYAYPKIANSRPVVIGMRGILGSTYGNHFVVAYQYSTDTNYYRCIDTLGNSNAVINVSWTAQCLWING